MKKVLLIGKMNEITQKMSQGLNVINPNQQPDEYSEDVEEDIKKKRYNPLKHRFGEPEFEEDCHTILTMMMAQCCKEFEKLPLLENVEILRNILYSGVWCRYELVREKRRKQQENQEKVK